MPNSEKLQTTKDRPHARSDQRIRFAFFGSSHFSILILEELEKAGTLPMTVVTTPDRPRGRGMKLSPTPVKEWALERNIPVLEPETLDADFTEKLAASMTAEACDAFIVASYGKIIPLNILDIPPHRSLNVHASLLPLYRGASPLEYAMLDDAKQTGISIIRMDEKMDHGPVIASEPVSVTEWPTYEDLEKTMGHRGGALLASILPGWIAGTVREQEQDHGKATYTKKIAKEDGLIDPNDEDQYRTFRKIQAYHEWPGAYFFKKRGEESIRVKVTKARMDGAKLVIERVILAGGKEIPYSLLR